MEPDGVDGPTLHWESGPIVDSAPGLTCLSAHEAPTDIGNSTGRSEACRLLFCSGLEVTTEANRTVGPTIARWAHFHLTVALGHASLGAFVTGSADRVGGFGLDQLLHRPLGQMADQITPMANIDRSAQLGQGRLGQSLTVDPQNPTTPRDSYPDTHTTTEAQALTGAGVIPSVRGRIQPWMVR